MKRPRVDGFIIWVMAVCYLYAAPAPGEPDRPWNVTLLGQMGGWCRTVEVSDRYAYVGEGATLSILDVANPSSPSLCAQVPFLDFYVADIEIKDRFAFVAGGGAVREHGLLVVDVGNPCLPLAGAFSPTPLPPYRVSLADDKAYVTCESSFHDPPGGIQIIDVSNPSSPTLCAPFIAIPSRAFKASVFGGIGYVACDDGLRILDLANPSQPTEMALYARFGCYDALFRDGLVYIATRIGLEIVDATNPATPFMRGRLRTNESYDLCLSEGLVFLAQDGSHQIEIADVTNPASPTSLASFPTSGWPWDAVVSSGTAYVADGPGGLAIVDISNASSPMLCATYDTLSNPTDVYVSDGVAYVANGVRGLKTIDVSNPRSPSLLASLATSTPAHKITVSEQRAYLTYGGGELYIIDVTNPSLPALLGSYTAPRAWDVAVSSALAYITNNDGFLIVDITDPSSPTLHGSFVSPGWPNDIDISGGLAFVADYASLQIVDISDPTLPFLRSSYPGSGVVEVSVFKGVAYITFDWAVVDVECIDVTHPDTPTLVGMYDLAGYEYYHSGGLHVSNDLAYVLLDGLRVLDVSDSTAPALAGYYPTERASFASDVFVSADFVYLADIYGLRIFQFTGAAAAAPSWRLYK